MSQRAFIVRVDPPEGVPIIGPLAHVPVDAFHHRHAAMQVQARRKELKLPCGCLYTARLVDTTDYERPATLAPLEHAEAPGSW